MADRNHFSGSERGCELRIPKDTPTVKIASFRATLLWHRLRVAISLPIDTIKGAQCALWKQSRRRQWYGHRSCGPSHYLLLQPFLAVVALTFALAVFSFVQGVLDLTDYLFTRKARKSSWVLINGVISTILGGMIWRHWPSSSLWALGQLVGIGMLMIGVTRLMMALATRKPAEIRNMHVPKVQAA